MQCERYPVQVQTGQRPAEIDHKTISEVPLQMNNMFTDDELGTLLLGGYPRFGVLSHPRPVPHARAEPRLPTLASANCALLLRPCDIRRHNVHRLRVYRNKIYHRI